MANSVDPDQTAPLFWVHAIRSSEKLGNYFQQTTSAVVIFQMHFFLSALRAINLIKA